MKNYFCVVVIAVVLIFAGACANEIATTRIPWRFVAAFWMGFALGPWAARLAEWLCPRRG